VPNAECPMQRVTPCAMGIGHSAFCSDSPPSPVAFSGFLSPRRGWIDGGSSRTLEAMPSTLRETRCAADLPRERLWSVGPAVLLTEELVALVLGTGRPGEDVLEVARALLEAGAGSLRRLAARPPGELQRVGGVGPAKAARLMAALELGSRLARELRPPAPRIRSPEDVLQVVSPRLRDLTAEEFHVLALDTQSQVLRDVTVTRGLLDSSLVHPREVFRAAIAEAAAGVILVHNHPSGDPTPSAEDRAVTRQLVAAGQLLDLPVYDHVIVAGDRWVSLAQAGLL